MPKGTVEKSCPREGAGSVNSVLVQVQGFKSHPDTWDFNPGTLKFLVLPFMVAHPSFENPQDSLQRFLSFLMFQPLTSLKFHEPYDFPSPGFFIIMKIGKAISIREGISQEHFCVSTNQSLCSGERKGILTLV